MHQRGQLHSARPGVSHGTQRGTLARKAWCSAPNVSSSVGPSYATTNRWQVSRSSVPYEIETPIAEQDRVAQTEGDHRPVHRTTWSGHQKLRSPKGSPGVVNGADRQGDPAAVRNHRSGDISARFLFVPGDFPS